MALRPPRVGRQPPTADECGRRQRVLPGVRGPSLWRVHAVGQQFVIGTPTWRATQPPQVQGLPFIGAAGWHGHPRSIAARPWQAQLGCAALVTGPSAPFPSRPRAVNGSESITQAAGTVGAPADTPQQLPRAPACPAAATLHTLPCWSMPRASRPWAAPRSHAGSLLTHTPVSWCRLPAWSRLRAYRCYLAPRRAHPMWGFPGPLPTPCTRAIAHPQAPPHARVHCLHVPWPAIASSACRPAATHLIPARRSCCGAFYNGSQLHPCRTLALAVPLLNATF